MPDKEHNIDALRTKEWDVMFGNLYRRDRTNGTPKKTLVVQKSLAGEATRDACQSVTFLPFEHILSLDIIQYIDSPFSERVQRTNLSVRQLETARKGLLNKGLVAEVWVGKVVLLAPTYTLYLLLGLEPPFKQDRWAIHTFLIQLAAKLIGQHPLVKYVKPEYAVDTDGSTVDLLVQYKDGQRHAYEIVHKGFSNIMHLAARLRGKGFSRLIYLCIDCNTAAEVRHILQSSYLDSDYRATIHCTFFAVLFKQRKALRLK